MRTSQKNITELKQGEIFVFGSNLSGHHAGGAARLAVEKFGAIWGVGNGKQGNTYALPTIGHHGHTLTVHEIKPFVAEFLYFAKSSPKLSFLVTEVGCGIAGYQPEHIAPLFKDALELENIYLPERFLKVLSLAHA